MWGHGVCPKFLYASRPSVLSSRLRLFPRYSRYDEFRLSGGCYHVCPLIAVISGPGIGPFIPTSLLVGHDLRRVVCISC